MITCLSGLFIVLVLIIGAIAHERDIYTNLKKYGNAKSSAWTCNIVSSEMKDDK